MVLSAGYKVQTQKEKNIFLKTLKQHLQSSFSLSKNIWLT